MMMTAPHAALIAKIETAQIAFDRAALNLRRARSSYTPKHIAYNRTLAALNAAKAELAAALA